MNENRLRGAQSVLGPAAIVDSVTNRRPVKPVAAGERTLASREIKRKSLSTFVKQRTYPWLSPAKRERQTQTVERGGTLLTLLTLLTHLFSAGGPPRGEFAL